jgi:hypothetical protein
MSSEIEYGERILPAGRAKFRLDEVGRLLRVSNSHLWNLVKSRALIVPQENIDAAPSRPSIYIPRESLADFIRRRRSGRGPSKGQRERSGTQRAVPTATAKTARRKKDLRRRSKSPSGGSEVKSNG